MLVAAERMPINCFPVYPFVRVVLKTPVDEVETGRANLLLLTNMIVTVFDLGDKVRLAP